MNERTVNRDQVLDILKKRKAQVAAAYGVTDIGKPDGFLTSDEGLDKLERIK